MSSMKSQNMKKYSRKNKNKKTKPTRKRIKNINSTTKLSRLPISLVQLKAGNNSRKLKNEIRKLLYSLYGSKKLSKTIYNNLINAI